ncbi:MAG: NAD-dependent epimerase/dehydratase family protein [Myxococcota bacterium]|nr:NAD-dependent epimerase/dehydratase family protein [Myxococcota bacterium]
MKVLVTGGAGFVGSHLVDALLAQGHQVRVLDALDPQVHGPERSRPGHLDPRAELLVGDVRDRELVARALEDVDVVSHQAAAVGVGQSMYEIERYVSVNAVGAAVLLEEVVARRDRIRRLTVASSMSIYGEGAYADDEGRMVFPGLRDEAALREQRFEMLGPEGKELRPVPTPEEKPLQPTSIYAITKRDHEEMCLAVGAAYGIPTVALRYFNIYGPRQALSNPYTGVMAIFSARIMNRNRPLIFEDGLQTRDFVHVSDIVQANLLALEKDEAVGRVYNVGTGRPTSVRRVAEALSEQLDFPDPPEVTGRFRAGDIRHCVADIARARRELGYEPRMSLEEGMRDLLAWLRTQQPEDRVADAARELEARGLTR